MFNDYPDSLIDFCNPVRLESFKSILFTNPVNNTFNELDLFRIKFPTIVIEPLFMRTKMKLPDPKNKVDFCFKPHFLNQGIPCEKLKEFTLKEETLKNEKINFDSKSKSAPISNLNSTKSINMPKLFFNQSKLLKKTNFDENFANQINLNDELKPLKELIPSPAWEWPFTLDPFQNHAIVALENSKSVFVAAHTSAGKTVVAEYAIAMCHNRGARVIYTSPIKALSNQKYREFKITFGNANVGLLTGDIKTGTNRYILVMTTEILHNMLKNDCPTLHDLDVVIMDEVHYLNDESRGHIWEQIMILLPKRIQLVMLSATVPNTMQFAEWLGRIRNTQIQVISTQKRPVPLEIYLFTGTGRNKRNEFSRIMDSNKNFINHGYQSADKIIKDNIEKEAKKFQTKPPPANQNQPNQQNHSSESKHKKFGNPELKWKQSDKCNTANKDHNQWLALFEALKEKDNLPVICFMFSRKRIQTTVSDLRSLSLLNEVEKSNVKRYYKEIINRKMMSKSDKKLPQIKEMEDLLTRGVAMHHAGLLPILKEIVEVLFSQGYVKILFATETFAVGVNMPARSVVFDSLEKHDGSKKRFLLSGEFTQMAGRAGRRGLDDIGTVIIMVKPQTKLYSQDELKRILIGSACQLESKFKISYNMILSLYRNRQFNIQYMIRHSFIEAARLKKYDDNCREYEEITERIKLNNINDLQCLDNKCNFDEVEKYYKLCVEYRQLKKDVTELLESKNEIQNFLCPGRLILLDSTSIQNGNVKNRLFIPALVLSLARQSSGDEKYKVKVLTLDLSEDDKNENSDEKEMDKDPLNVPVRPTDAIVLKNITEAVPKIFLVTLNDINKVCQMKSKIDVQEIEKYWMSRFFRKCSWLEWINKNHSFSSAMLTICTKSSTDTANYDKELNIKDPRHKALLSRYFTYERCLTEFPCSNCLLLADHFRHINQVDKMVNKLDELQQNLSDENLAFLPDYRHKVAILKELEFLNPTKDTIKLKGQIACEIESYEIVVTEVILSGVFVNAAPSDIAASLSCLMFENKTLSNESSEIKLADFSPPLQKIMKEIINIVKKINAVQMNHNVNDNEIQINCGLMESVRLWTKGGNFADISEITEVQDGDIVRCLQRLCELLRHCESAAKVMADFGMAALFKQTQECIYRGIVSTSSLYVDDV